MAMKGIQINNYFNNHITLNGKKVNQEAQPIAQVTRSKHLNNIPFDSENNVAESKSPPKKTNPMPLKKRTNTLVELKKHLPQKRSISVERQRNATSGKKKEEIPSEEQEKDEDVEVNTSNRKLKILTNKGGLGKRSKSTIIKSSHIEIPKETMKKQIKKMSSNQTSESAKAKSKRKKSSKVMETTAKTSRPASKPSIRKQLFPPSMKQPAKKQKITLKLDKTKQKQRGDKKSARSYVKSGVGSDSKHSKPASARQKKGKKCQFIEELKEKYEHQTNIAEVKIERMISAEDPNIDNDFFSAMSSLEKALNSVGSKQKLKRELQMISERLKQFKIESESGQDSQDEKQSDKFFMSQKSVTNRDMASSLMPQHLRPRDEEKEEQNEQPEGEKRQLYEQSEEEEIPQNHFGNEEYGARIIETNPLVGKRATNFAFMEEPEEKVEDNWSDRKKEIQLLKRFKSQSNKMMEKIGLSKVEQPVQPKQEVPKQLVLDNVSGLSSSNNNHDSSRLRQDKYPFNNLRSPKFDETQLMGVISLKQKFLSSKHDKMSELVKKMFEKQLVSPRSFEWQMKSLNKKYEQENSVLQSFKKQAEQMSSILSEIKKDKEQIQGIDELIRNEKWDEAEKFVVQGQKKLENIVEEKEEYENKWKLQNQGDKHFNNDGFVLSGWEKQEGWEKVKIEQNEVQNNEFIDLADLAEVSNRPRINDLDDVGELGQFSNRPRINDLDDMGELGQFSNRPRSKDLRNMGQSSNRVRSNDLGGLREIGQSNNRAKTNDLGGLRQFGQSSNRGRRNAQPQVDIDAECGVTESSVELSEHSVKADEKECDQQFIYYNQDGGHDANAQKHEGLIRLIEVAHDEKDEEMKIENQNSDIVIHIKDEEVEEMKAEGSVLKNGSQVSANSSQKQREGFSTNLYFIKQYCIAICEFVRDNEIFKSQFKYNISKPLQFNVKKMLQSLREDDNPAYMFSKRTSKSAISQKIWNQFNLEYQSLHCNSSPNKVGERFVFQKEQELIFARMIYDVLNESLSFERPGGEHGKAIPWKQSAKHLKNIKQINKYEVDNVQSYDLMFGVAIARVIQWGSCLCGFLPDTVELDNTQIDEPYVNHIRQTRMAFLLQKMMAEEELVMTNFELQDTEVEFKLSQLVYSELISECCDELSFLADRQH